MVERQVDQEQGGEKIGGIDRGTFRRIFVDHWDPFKECHPGYAGGYYEEVVRKMLSCGKRRQGTANTCVRSVGGT